MLAVKMLIAKKKKHPMKNNSDNQFYVVTNARFLEQILILIILIIQRTTKDFQIWWSTQYAHDVVLTSVRRRFNVMDVVWMSKRYRVLTESLSKSACYLGSPFVIINDSER